MNEQSKAGFTIERIYSATVQEMWDLWATKEGFESWWGPQGFRVDVHLLEPRQGGALHYDMVADTPEMVAAMAEMGRPASHGRRGTYALFAPLDRLVLTHIIDFLPGVDPYESVIEVDFHRISDQRARMVVTLRPMHDEETSAMQLEGFTSQLTKLDERFGWKGE